MECTYEKMKNYRWETQMKEKCSHTGLFERRFLHEKMFMTVIIKIIINIIEKKKSQYMWFWMNAVQLMVNREQIQRNLFLFFNNISTWFSFNDFFIISVFERQAKGKGVGKKCMKFGQRNSNK